LLRGSGSIFKPSLTWFGLYWFLFWFGLIVPGVTDLLGLRIFLRLLVVDGGDSMGAFAVFVCGMSGSFCGITMSDFG